MTLKQIEEKIEKIKLEISNIDGMRPGHLVKQYNVCGNKNCKCKDPKNPKKHGPYILVPYTLNGKRSTTFIHAHYVGEVKKQIKNYKKLKSLIKDWAKLGLAHSILKMKLIKNEVKIK